MTKFLLVAGLLASMTGISAAADVSEVSLRKSPVQVAVKNVRNTKAEKTSVKQLAPGVALTQTNGMKRINVDNGISRTLTNSSRRVISRSTTPEGYVLFENFEDWDGTDGEWTPEGWTVDMRGDVPREESWGPCSELPFCPPPADGQYYYSINFSMGNQDEWFISPEVTVEDGMDLYYWVYIDPVFLFDLNNVDWGTFEFIGEPQVSATLQIWAQAEGQDWVMLRDYFDEYKEYSLEELFTMTPDAMEKNSVSLADFYGKKTRVAFRYVGTDGNTMFIDAIGIGYASLDNVSYYSPTETLFWGFERTADLSGLTAGIAQYPVYAPLTWQNMTEAEATFSWKYCDPITGDFVTSDDQYELTVTYVPDYRTESAKKNNLFYPPTLIAEAPHATPGEYTAPYTFFQAGGKPEHTLGDGSEFVGNLLPFDFNELGLGITTVTDDDLGAMGIPVFGHNEFTDAYWLNYSLNGEEPMPSDYSHLIGIANVFFPSSEAPLVVNGVTVYGYGKIAEDAELKATVYGVPSDYSTDYENLAVIATATISGAEVLSKDPADRSYLCMPFDFEAPAVIKSTGEHPAYFIMLEGFNSDKVEYFAPIQSRIDNPFGVTAGYILNHIDLSAQIGRDPYYSIKKMVYKENGEYVNPASAFAIAMDAEYPWLTTECEEISFTPGETEIEVALGSYYDGSQLTVTAPAGVTATCEGRYDECHLNVVLNDAAVVVDGDIRVEGPGVSVVIPVNYNPGGIESVITDAADIEAVYDLTGRRVNVNALTEGVYIVKYSDSKTHKVVVR